MDSVEPTWSKSFVASCLIKVNTKQRHVQRLIGRVAEPVVMVILIDWQLIWRIDMFGRLCMHLHGFLLGFQDLLQLQPGRSVVCQQAARGQSCPTGSMGSNADAAARLVHQVDGLVGQLPVSDVAR